MNANQIRRSALTMWLQGVRFPLTIAEAVMRRADDKKTWPPALAFEVFERTVKQMVGRITGDETLLELAALQRGEIALRRRALALHTDAASKSSDVRRAAEKDEARLEREREAADRRSRERKAQAEAERRDAERALQRRSTTQRATAATTAATRAKTVDKHAAKADADRLRKKAQVLRAKEKAVATQRKVLDIDKAVRTKKAARRAG